MKLSHPLGGSAIKAFAEEAVRKLAESADLYYHLVLIVGLVGSGKTEAMKEVRSVTGAMLRNLNLELSKRMLDLTARQRTMKLPLLLEEVLTESGGKTALLDNTEILFDPRLQQDPLRLLQRLSRVTPVVATWNGSVQAGQLLYAEPGHAEYRHYPAADLQIVTIAPAATPPG